MKWDFRKLGVGGGGGAVASGRVHALSARFPYASSQLPPRARLMSHLHVRSEYRLSSPWRPAKLATVERKSGGRRHLTCDVFGVVYSRKISISSDVLFKLDWCTA